MNHSMRRALTALLVVMLTAAVAAFCEGSDVRLQDGCRLERGFDPFGFGRPTLNDSGPSRLQRLHRRGAQVIVRTDEDGSLTTLADDANRFSFLGRTLRSTGPPRIARARADARRQGASNRTAPSRVLVAQFLRVARF
jgi:hypothetical protein